MSLILSGTDGLSDVDGSAATPAIRGTDTNTGIFFPAADTIAFAEGGAEVARFDSSGNLGLGVTPSAWDGSFKAFQVSNTSLFSQDSTGAGWWSKNARNVGGTWYYIGTGSASYIEQGAGAFKWNTAASGTAGNAITFTQAMTLDASGKLVLGGTSTDGIITLGSASYGTGAIYQTTKNNGGTFYYGIESSAGASIVNGSSAYASILFTQGATPLQFGTNNNIRATIDSSGNLLIGTTSGASKLYVSDSSSPGNQSVYFENTNNSLVQRVLSINATRNTTNGTYKYLSCSISTVQEKFYVFDSGSAYNITGTYGTISDIKLKENIVDATPKLDDVMQLQVRNFNFKATPEENHIGFIAQEFEQVFPSMVDVDVERDENGEETGQTTKTIKTSVLIPILVKAIQEQQAIIESLKARLDAANL
jgi:hypothetical protein